MSHRSDRSLMRRAIVVFLASAPVACRTGGPVVVTAVPARDGVGSATATRATSSATFGWSVDTREHVDLWLHGFALLQADSSLVPYFKLSYRSDIQQLRRTLNARTLLDANAERLKQRIAANPALTSAQFLALYFANWDDLRRGTQRFLRDNGDVRQAESNEMARMYATLRTYFPTAADREWLRTFVDALEDERSRFFAGYWRQQQAQRAGVRAAIASAWAGTYGSAFARFMSGSSQRYGMLLLSLPLGAEGRSVSLGRRDNFITVGFPSTTGDEKEPFYTLAHEVVGPVANTVVRDHATPADTRSGDAAKWSTLAAVRGGDMLLTRIAPDLVVGYRRFYLTTARVSATGDLATHFARIFPLPDGIRSALERQIDIVLAGI